MKTTNVDKEMMDFVDEQRMRCLWYMPDNYYPASTARKLADERKRCGESYVAGGVPLSIFSRSKRLSVARLRDTVQPPFSERLGDLRNILWMNIPRLNSTVKNPISSRS